MEDMKEEMEKMKGASWYKDYMEELLREYQEIIFSVCQLAEMQREEARQIFPLETMETSAEVYLMAEMIVKSDDETLESAKKTAATFMKDCRFIKKALGAWYSREISHALQYIFGQVAEAWDL